MTVPSDRTIYAYWQRETRHRAACSVILAQECEHLAMIHLYRGKMAETAMATKKRAIANAQQHDAWASAPFEAFFPTPNPSHPEKAPTPMSIPPMTMPIPTPPDSPPASPAPLLAPERTGQTPRPRGTEFLVEVVRLGACEKLENADTLSLTRVLGDYPVIFRTGQFRPGDLAVYIPVDAVVDTAEPCFAFLGAQPVEGQPQPEPERLRIKAKRLRGTFSMGLLVEAPPGAKEGDDMADALGVEKYLSHADKLSTGGARAPSAPAPAGIFSPEYGLDAVRHYGRIAFVEGEEVIITEKIHGATGRLVRGLDGAVSVGTRMRWTLEAHDELWWPTMRRLDLVSRMDEIPLGFVVYGEVYGAVQDLTYDHAPKEASFLAFDVFNGLEGKWLDYDVAKALLDKAQIPTVPVLYRGPWKEDLRSLAEGQSTLASCIREGIVVRVPVERRTEHNIRCALKHVGESYQLRNGTKAEKRQRAEDKEKARQDARRARRAAARLADEQTPAPAPPEEPS